MSNKTIRFDLNGAVATITLNRPEAMNTLNWELVRDAGETLVACEKNPEVRVVVITGIGRAFCGGGDVSEFKEHTGSDTTRYHYELASALNEYLVGPIRRMAKPVIAAINGVAAGAGVGLALVCDLRVITTEAKFILAYTNVAICPDCGTSYFLPRLVGIGRATEMYMLNRPIPAQEALSIGMVNRVVDAKDLSSEVLALATQLASGPTLAYGETKRLFDNSFTHSLAEQAQCEAFGVGVCSATKDYREGVDAFLEKRLPRFRGA